ncbi:MAG TPA: DMT family transporter [bacterium]|nr:DMT family transporter [bacterium]
MAVVLWGAIYPAAKIALHDIPVVDFIFLRVFIAAAILFVLAGPPRRFVPPRALWPAVAFAGVAQIASQTLLHAGIRFTTAGIAALLLATSPLLSGTWSALFWRVHLAGRQWFGLLAGLLGIVFVIGPGGPTFDGAHVLGDMLSLGAAAVWVLYSTFIGPLVGALGTIRATAWSMIVSVSLFTPFAVLPLEHVEWSGVSWQAWAGLFYSAIVGQVVAMVLWGRSIHSLGVHQAMVYMYLEPISAVVIAAALLGESLSSIQVGGAVLTFAGMWWASGRSISLQSGARQRRTNER